MSKEDRLGLLNGRQWFPPVQHLFDLIKETISDKPLEQKKNNKKKQKKWFKIFCPKNNMF